MYLLDTNVIAELRKAQFPKVDQKVLAWANSVSAASLFLSVITVLELEKGVILREHVITSGRKLRVYSLRETLRLFSYLLRTGPRALRQREGLEFWYGERRADTTKPEESG